jgi:hypothetical protein
LSATLARMGKVFYLGGGSHRLGMLRAIVSIEQLNSIVSPGELSYLGPTLPENGLAGPATVIELSPGEAVEPWATGFSRVNQTPADFDQRLKFLPEPEEPPKQAPQQKRHSGSALIRLLISARHPCN